MSSSTPSHSSAGRVAAVVSGAIAGLVAFGLIVAGAVLLYGNSHKDKDGYVSTGSDRFHTRTYALATDDLDVDTDVPGGMLDDSTLGHVRVKATSRDGKPVFVGIAPTKDVDSYLAGTGHATVTDVNYAPFRADYDTQPGGRPTAPGTQRFWAASTNGTGTQALEWKVRDGNWSVVVMNADASANVDVGVSAGSDVPWLAPLGWGLVGGGTFVLLVAAALVFVGVREPRSDRGPAGGVAPAAA
jgi:hypothetical protein